MDDVTGAPLGGQDRLARDLRNVIADAEVLLRDAAHEASDGYDGMRARLEETVQAAKAQLAALQQSAVDQAREARRATDRYVHDHPWNSVAIGVGAGAALGLLVGVLIARK